MERKRGCYLKKKVGFLLSFVFLLQGCGQATVMEAIPTTEGGGVAVEEEISESPNATGEDAEYGVSAKGVVGDESQEVKGEGDAISGTERSENERLDSTRPEPKKSESVSLMSESPIPDIPEPEVHEITLAFAGDINFDDNWCNMIYYHSHAEELSDVIDEDYLECMRSADLFWINNEFTYSDRGAPLNGKMYTFRTAPENVELLTQMGVDIVGLANNHVYDYGEEALIDTMDTLQNAGIPYVGAGHDLAEAMSPVYFDLDGFTIAYVAASRAEKFKMTPQATESSPGILRCYDNTLFLEEIEEGIRQGQMHEISFTKGVTVGLPYRSALYYLPEAADRFREMAPTIPITPYFNKSLQSQPMGKIEWDIEFSIEENARRMTGIKEYPLFESAIYCILPKDDPLADREIICGEDLKDRKLITTNTKYPNVVHHVIREIMHAHHNSHFLTADAQTVLHAVASHSGVSIVPGIINDHSGELKWIPFDCKEKLNCVLLTNVGENRQNVLDFINVLREVYREHEGEAL